jgi:cytidine deaminase
VKRDDDPALISADDAMRGLVGDARDRARAPISHFAVGAVARGQSGALYMGANLEFAGAPLGATVHAEQAAIASAWAHGESGITALAVSAAPCGHCRQFLNELRGAESLRILVPGAAPIALGELLPAAFGPRDLGAPGRLLDPGTHPLTLEDAAAAADPLAVAALGAAEASYAPYSGTFSGVALALEDGTTLTGRIAENAAFNPGLPPLQAALIELAARRVPYEAIRRAVLVEAAGPASARGATEALLAAIAPGAGLTFLRAIDAP